MIFVFFLFSVRQLARARLARSLPLKLLALCKEEVLATEKSSVPLKLSRKKERKRALYSKGVSFDKC